MYQTCQIMKMNHRKKKLVLRHQTRCNDIVLHVLQFTRHVIIYYYGFMVDLHFYSYIYMYTLKQEHINKYGLFNYC